MGSANKRRRYFLTSSLIDRTTWFTQNNLWLSLGALKVLQLWYGKWLDNFLFQCEAETGAQRFTCNMCFTLALSSFLVTRNSSIYRPMRVTLTIRAAIRVIDIQPKETLHTLVTWLPGHVTLTGALTGGSITHVSVTGSTGVVAWAGITTILVWSLQVEISLFTNVTASAGHVRFAATLSTSL